MRMCSPVAAGLFGALLAVAAWAWPGLAVAAQSGASHPTAIRAVNAHHPFPTRAVWPHEIMTYEERYDTWLKMREAMTPAERYAVWAKKRADLENRAAEHGMVLRDQPSMMMGREERYGAYAPYAGPGAQAPGAQALGAPALGAHAAVAPYGQPYAAPYQQRPAAPERPAQAPGWVGPHYFGVVPHMMPPIGR